MFIDFHRSVACSTPYPNQDFSLSQGLLMDLKIERTMESMLGDSMSSIQLNPLMVVVVVKISIFDDHIPMCHVH
jgi:hypothetical protein